MNATDLLPHIVDAYNKGKKDAFDMRENADGCTGCAFIEHESWEMPCSRCKRNAKDYWRSDSNSFFEEEKHK